MQYVGAIVAIRNRKVWEIALDKSIGFAGGGGARMSNILKALFCDEPTPLVSVVYGIVMDIAANEACPEREPSLLDRDTMNRVLARLKKELQNERSENQEEPAPRKG